MIPKKKKTRMGRDGLPRKSMRIDSKIHELAKAVYEERGFESMQDYVQHLILKDSRRNANDTYHKVYKTKE